MAITAAPYGLKAVKRADGMPYAGATSQYLIDPAGLNKNIFNGSLVFLNADGYIDLVTGTGANSGAQAFPVANSFTGALGVLVGCEYENAQGKVIFDQYYPANVTGEVKAYVIDDPNVLFQAQLSGTISQSDIGANTKLSAAQSTSTGSTATGNSTVALSHTTQTTTAAFRIVKAVSPLSDAYVDVLVRLNIGYSSATNAVGR